MLWKKPAVEKIDEFEAKKVEIKNCGWRKKWEEEDDDEDEPFFRTFLLLFLDWVGLEGD